MSRRSSWLLSLSLLDRELGRQADRIRAAFTRSRHACARAGLRRGQGASDRHDRVFGVRLGHGRRSSNSRLRSVGERRRVGGERVQARARSIDEARVAAAVAAVLDQRREEIELPTMLVSVVIWNSGATRPAAASGAGLAVVRREEVEHGGRQQRALVQAVVGAVEVPDPVAPARARRVEGRAGSWRSGSPARAACRSSARSAWPRRAPRDRAGRRGSPPSGRRARPAPLLLNAAATRAM